MIARACAEHFAALHQARTAVVVTRLRLAHSSDLIESTP
jgi:hypothetical protein